MLDNMNRQFSALVPEYRIAWVVTDKGAVSKDNEYVIGKELDESSIASTLKQIQHHHGKLSSIVVCDPSLLDVPKVIEQHGQSYRKKVPNRDSNLSESLNTEITKPLFLWSKAIMEQFFSQRLDIIYMNALRKDLQGNVDFAVHSALGTMAKSVYLENENFVVRYVQSDAEPMSPQWMIQLCQEIQNNQRKPEVVRYTDNTRRVKGLKEITPPMRTDEVSFRQGGVYVIPGGLGELGYRLCESLIKKYQAKLVIQGRSQLSEQGLSRLKHLQSLANNPDHIQYHLCDASIYVDVNRSIEQTKQRWGDIHGVLVLLTTHKDAYLFNKSWDDFEQVTRSKVDGTYHLDEATKECALDFFVVFSSQAALGMAGGIDYAYGCEFQNEFVLMRNALKEEGLRQGKSQAIGWSRWQWDKYVTEEFDQWVVSLGYDFLNMEIGMKCLEDILASDSQEVFVLYGNHSRVMRHFDMHSGMLIENVNEELPTPSEAIDNTQSIISQSISETFAETEHDLSIQLNTLSANELEQLAEALNDGEHNEIIGSQRATENTLSTPDRRVEVQSSLKGLIASSLKVPVIQDNDHLAELGIDSIAAIRLIAKINEEFGIELKPKQLLDAETVTHLVDQIMSVMNDFQSLTPTESSNDKVFISSQTDKAECSSKSKFLEQLIRLLNQLLKVESVDVEQTFTEVGLDSIMAVRFVTRIEEVTGIKLSPKSLFEYPTPLALSKFVDENHSKASTTSSEDNQVNAYESIIAEVISDVLKVNQPSFDEPFDSMGLDSILAVRLVNKINHATGIEMSPKWIVEHKNIRQLSNKLEQAVNS